MGSGISKTTTTTKVISQFSKGICQHTLTAHTARVHSVIQLKDGRLASGAGDKFILIWDLLTQKVVMTLEGHSSDVRTVLQLKDGFLCSGGADHSLRIWDIGVTASKDKRTLDNGKIQAKVIVEEAHKDEIRSIRQLNDERLCSCSNDNTLKLWDLNPTQPVCMMVLEGHTGWVRSVTQFDDGKHAQLVSSSYDGTMRMWNVLTGACDMALKAHDKPVKTIIQLDDSRLCSCSYDQTIKIWDMNASKCEMILKGHTSYVMKVIQMDDGRLCSAGADNILMIWNDLTTGACEMALIGHTDPVNSVIQLADGRLVSCSNDCTIRVWK